MDLWWSIINDALRFFVTLITHSQLIKRTILFHIAQIYNPLELIIIQTKILIQNLWKTQLEWDESIYSDWIVRLFRSDLEQLAVLKTPRHPLTKNTKNIEWFLQHLREILRSMHLPTLANKSYSAKFTVTPLKSISFPRLVLCDGLLLLWREYKTAIGKTRRESWQRFVTIKENRDLWGAIYKLCSRKVTPGIVVATPKDWQVSDKERPTWETCVRALLDFLVLNNTQDITAAQKMKRRAADDLPTTSDVPPFDKEEVRRVVGSMRNSKAPSPDRIEVEVLKASYEVIHKELRDFNACLRYGSFPRIWKQGSIRTLLKDADRDATNLTSYRPICLLSVMEKCLEKLLAERLRPVFMDSRYAAANQFGFQKGKSTTDAILVIREMVAESTDKYVLAILFDIKGTFDHVWWPSILYRLRERKCPRNLFLFVADYLRGWTSLVGKHEVVSKNATRGCPQGSILGPSLWNFVFDDLLLTLERRAVRAIAYAYDLLILVSG